LFQAQVLDSAHEIRAVNGIPIPKQITGGVVKREGFDHLLGGPEGRGSVRDVEVKDFAALMGQD
jgi:hypothetical protein